MNFGRLAACWLVSFAGAHALADQAGPVVPVIPAPRIVVHEEGAFVLNENARVGFAAAGAESAARYFVDLVRRTRGLSLSVADKDRSAASILFELSACEGVSHEEGYSLRSSPGRIVVCAGDPRGLFYGAVTLWQLVTAQPHETSVVRIPALRISDAPRFSWRGLMLDSARHYQSTDFIKRLIDLMALHKLNVLHWHLTDDQAWRLEIRKWPGLTATGAWRTPAGSAAAADIDPATGRPRQYGGYYSQAQVREIVAYAAARHIRIVPEIEMPGHASAAIAAYPQFGAVGAAPRAAPADWGVYPNLFDVTDAAFGFLQDVLAEVMDLFPDEYVHVGGDEAVKDQWRASRDAQQRIRDLGLAGEHELQSWFMERIGRFLQAHGRRMIGWDEILEGGLPANAVVMSWRGVDGAIAAASAGHEAVLSPGPTLYFDNRPLDAPTPGRGRVVSVEDVYRFDPAPAGLTEAQRSRILGLQANVWTEHIRTEQRVEYMTFPRASALAEVAWSAPERIDWRSFSERLPQQLSRYRALNVHYAAKPPREPGAASLRTSHELRLCSENLVLSLEDDAPLQGPRATFLVDIMNPCWIYPAAELSRVSAIRVAVGQAPFNFQIGEEVEKIALRAPKTRYGELEIRIGGCGGEILAVAPLAPAASNPAVTQLPLIPVEAREGSYDLCFVFTQGAIDPMWLIHSVEPISSETVREHG